MRAKRIKQVVMHKHPGYHKKFCVYHAYTSYGNDTICYNGPVEVCKTYPEAVSKLKKLIAKSGGRYIILQYLNSGWGKSVIQNEDKLPKKEYAVFSTNYRGNKNQMHYWGTIKGVDRHHAMSKIETTGFYNSKYRCIFLHILENGKLLKNPFPHIPILEISGKTDKRSGATVSNIIHVPLRRIIKNGKRINFS